jgi:superfamily II DNA/RNA helicase
MVVISETPLYPGLQKTLTDLGLEKPTAVQAQAIPLALQKKDLLVCAQTGSGKTLAYLIPTIQQLASEPLDTDAGTLALILVPTRELARQVYKQCETLIASTPLNASLTTGGESMKFQTAALRKNPEILVATTGRLVELLNTGSADLSTLKMLIIDEADQMLDLGFSPDVLRIAEASSADRQTLMFSATLGHTGLDHISASLLNQPETIDLSPKEEDTSTISHKIMLADDRKHKEKILGWILNNQPFTRALVFSNTRDNADRLGGLIRYYKHVAGVLHGEKEHSVRKNLLDQFANGKMRVLVASDVAARGLDIKDVDLVINFDMPRRGDDYTHRVGRTGRAGNEGVAISLVNPQEWDLMISIQRYLKLDLERLYSKEVAGHFNGPKKVKSSGKSAGSKEQKKKKKSKASDSAKKSAKPAAKRKKTSAEQRDDKPKRSGPMLTGNETLKRKKGGLKPD